MDRPIEWLNVPLSSREVQARRQKCEWERIIWNIVEFTMNVRRLGIINVMCQKVRFPKGIRQSLVCKKVLGSSSNFQKCYGIGNSRCYYLQISIFDKISETRRACVSMILAKNKNGSFGNTIPKHKRVFTQSQAKPRRDKALRRIEIEEERERWLTIIR